MGIGARRYHSRFTGSGLSSVALGLMLALPGAAGAHHGIASFDLNETIELTGTVTDLDWVNPHSWLYLEVTTASGEVEQIRCELRAATVLRRSGWDPDMFPVGSTVTVSGSPHRSDAHSCYTATLTFADGSSIDRYGQRTEAAPVEMPAARAPRLANGDPNITGDWAPEQFVMTDPRGQAGVLVPLSAAEQFEPGEVPAGREAMRGAVNEGETGAPADRDEALLAPGPTWGADEVELTALGEAAAADFEMYTTDNPRMRCEVTSILFDWDFDGPVNRITQRDDRIVLEYGQYGFTRTVHMNLDAHPADIEPSRAGHSIGRWEGDTLVVDTFGILPGIIAPPVFHGDKLHVIERFTVDTDNWTLTRAYEATDPDYFMDVYAGTDDVFGIADVPYLPDECQELSFLDYGDAETGEPAASVGSVGAAESAGDDAPWWAFWEWF